MSVTFFPDGETNIPNQTPVPEVSDRGVPAGRSSSADQPSPYGQPNPQRPAELRPNQVDPEFSKAIIRAAVINGAVLVIAVLVAYVFPVVDDPSAATMIVLAAAVFAGVHLSYVILRSQRRRREQGLTVGTQPMTSTYGQVQPAVADRPAGGTQPYGALQQATPGDFMMTVEDVFTITGRGTVVTGRVSSGELHTGQVVVILRGGEALREVEVTGIEMFRKMADVATTGENVGLLLAGISRDDVYRGDVLTA